MNNDLISREAVIERIKYEADVCNSGITRGVLKFLQVIVENMPSAVDAVEHAKWEINWCDNNLIGHEYEECSNCGCSMVDTNQFWNSNYCPNCGARMDGDGNGKA